MIIYSQSVGKAKKTANSSLKSRPFPAPVFDHSVFAYCKQSKTGAGKGLETRLASSKVPPMRLAILKDIKSSEPALHMKIRV